MTAPNEWYVAAVPFPSGSGDGTIGDPWETLTQAFSGITRDTVDGDKINIKGTITHPGFAAVDIATTYGVPTQTAPLIIRGYGSSVNDGTRGVLDGNDMGQTILGGEDTNYLYVIDMEIKDSGTSTAASMVVVGDHCVFINCLFQGSGNHGLKSDKGLYVSNCHFTNIDSNCIVLGLEGYVRRCVFDNDTGSEEFDYAVKLEGTVTAKANFDSVGLARVEFCIMDLDGVSKGVNLQSKSDASSPAQAGQEVVRCLIRNNSFYTTGTGTYAVTGTAGTNKNQEVICENNLIEGFDDSGAIGLRLRSNWSLFHGGNAAYDNTTNYDISGDVVFTWGAATNSALSASPFTAPGSHDWTPVGSEVIEKAEPDYINGASSLDIRQGVDKGATQKATVGSGSGYYGISQGLHTIESGITA